MLAVMLNIKGEENGFHDHLNHDKEHHQVLLFKLSAGDDHLVPGLCIAFSQDQQLGSENLSADNFCCRRKYKTLPEAQQNQKLTALYKYIDIYRSCVIMSDGWCFSVCT